MRRRNFCLFGVTLLAMIAVAALSQTKKPSLLLLDWASHASKEKPPVAVLIEMGIKDTEPTAWDGKAVVAGAEVVHREGYRFRQSDKLTDKTGWTASSHRPIRVPPRQPQVARLEGIDTVGVVLHLNNVGADATLTLEKEGREKTMVPLKDVLAGQPHKIWDGAAVVRLVTTTSALTSGSTEDDFPAAAYGPDGTLWVAYVGYHVRDENSRVEQHPYQEQPANFKSLFVPEFADQLFVKYLRDGKWSEPLAITGPNEDLVRCAIAVEGDGTAWVTYCAHRKGSHDVYARPISKKFGPEAGANPAPRPGPEQRLTPPDEHALNPVVCTNQSGHIQFCYTHWGKDGLARLAFLSCRDGKWVPGLDPDTNVRKEVLEDKRGNIWAGNLTSAVEKGTVLAFDSYNGQDYDVGISVKAPLVERDGDLASSSRFEARPSACFDSKDRLWIAYEEGPEKWGHDYGSLVPNAGEPLYSSRSVRVVCLQDGKLFKPAAELPTSKVKAPTAGETVTTQGFERATRYAYPRLGLDGKGRLWLTYRQKFGTRYSTIPGSYWLTYARRLDGDHWTEPIEVHHSDGLLDNRPALLPHASGGLWIIHNGDDRRTVPNKLHNRVFASFLDLPGESVEPKLVPHEPGTKDSKSAVREREAVQRMREYRIEVGGKKYQLLRGEFHRHTEISWDGGADGSLEDMFRYAIDAAGMDWIGNGDHDNGAGREYSWWLVQKFTDAYHVKDHFTPMFCYERSVSYPHGHRNCMFAKRGVRTLPRLAQPDPDKRVAGIHADDTKMLYRYLKEMDGICAVHTSATGMGTDWRDNDPKVEPFVEIYQGDRMSYEMEDAPRAGYDPKSGKKPANIAGWFPKGFINNALDKGYRLSFQSSSDHWSTHISYAVAITERHDRDAILDAFKKRHSYGATDNIVLDVRSGDHLMGDEFRTRDAPGLQVQVQGTSAIDRIDVLKDSEVVQTFRPEGSTYKGNWTDPKPSPGVHYYYVRVMQKDGQLAWGSPLWIDCAK
jgi:hypothetical protein